MSRLTVDHEMVRLRFSRPEKALGLVRDLDVPLDHVASADPLRGPWWHSVRGLRVGFSLPRVRLLGRWRSRGRRQLVDLRRRQPALRIALTDQGRYDEVLVSSPDADEVLAQLRQAGVGAEHPDD